MYLKLLYEEHDITEDINNEGASFIYTDRLDELDSISIKMSNFDKKWDKGWFPLKGDKIECIIIDDNKKLQCGEFFIDEIEKKGFDLIIKAVSLDINSSLKLVKINKVWESTSLKMILEDIAKKHNLNLNFEAVDIKINRVEQIEKSDGAFINELTDLFCYSIKVFKDRLICFSQADYEKNNEILTINKAEVTEFKFISKELDTVSAVEIRYFNPVFPVLIKTEVKEERKGFKNQTKKILKINNSFGAVGSKAEQEKFLSEVAKGILKKTNISQETVNLHIPGNLNIVAGSVIRLEGFDVWNGKYLITKTTQILEKDLDTLLEGRRIYD